LLIQHKNITQLISHSLQPIGAGNESTYHTFFLWFYLTKIKNVFREIPLNDDNLSLDDQIE